MKGWDIIKITKTEPNAICNEKTGKVHRYAIIYSAYITSNINPNSNSLTLLTLTV